MNDQPHAPTMKAIARIVDEMIHEFEPHPDHPGQRWGEFSNRITASLSPPVRQEGGDGLISRLRAYARDIGSGPVTDDLMLAAAELRIRELEAADVQRVRDISRLTEERDAAREALSGSSSTASGVVVPREEFIGWLDWMDDELSNQTCSQICDKTHEAQGCPSGSCAIERGKAKARKLRALLGDTNG